MKAQDVQKALLAAGLSVEVETIKTELAAQGIQLNQINASNVDTVVDHFKNLSSAVQGLVEAEEFEDEEISGIVPSNSSIAASGNIPGNGAASLTQASESINPKARRDQRAATVEQLTAALGAAGATTAEELQALFQEVDQQSVEASQMVGEALLAKVRSVPVNALAYVQQQAAQEVAEPENFRAAVRSLFNGIGASLTAGISQ